jgi:hypothetical protein
MMLAVKYATTVAMINGASSLIKTYASGVITSTSCGTDQTLSVAVIGYNKTNEKPYWIVQAAMGTSWGN